MGFYDTKNTTFYSNAKISECLNYDKVKKELKVKEKQKTHHPVAFNIPIELWDKIEVERLKQKQKTHGRKLTVKDHLVSLMDKGING